MNIMEWLSRSNLLIYCCVAAVLSMTSYLAGFSCEIAWILEAKGNLPTASYLLCAGYFILFIASTILIHGLATQMAWGLFSWSTIIALMALPELYLVIAMVTQHWGFQSTHGLTELVSYILRLIINCFALLCVIPTAMRWRQDKRVRKQLESLANRLQLTTPIPNTTPSNYVTQAEKNGSIRSTTSRRSKLSDNCFDNPVFQPQENLPVEGLSYPSDSEFNASIFGLNPSLYIGPPVPAEPLSKRTQSLLDLRFIFPTSKGKSTKNDGDQSKLNNNISDNNLKITNMLNTVNADEPFYHTIEPMYNGSSEKDPKGLSRNCVSLENLNNISRLYRNDLMYGNNLLQNYAMHWQQVPYGYPNTHPYAAYYYYGFPPTFAPAGYFAGYQDLRTNQVNSRQSLGTNSTDDFRKYRDVAL